MVRTTSTEPLPRPLPREAVRDLLGITRALYRAELERVPADPERTARLQNIGQLFRQALTMSAKYEPDTMAGRAAFDKARTATLELGHFVADVHDLAPAVAATALKLKLGR